MARCPSLRCTMAKSSVQVVAACSLLLVFGTFGSANAQSGYANTDLRRNISALCNASKPPGLAAYNLGAAGEADRYYPEALSCYVHSYREGYWPAASRIAHLVDAGLGVPHNTQLAVRWYMLAASHGDPEAEYIMGVAYSKGLGVQRNNQQALYWINRAAAHGNRSAQAVLQRVQADSGISASLQCRLQCQSHETNMDIIHNIGPGDGYEASRRFYDEQGSERAQCEALCDRVYGHQP